MQRHWGSRSVSSRSALRSSPSMPSDGDAGTNLPEPIKYPEIRRFVVDPEYARRDARAVEDPIAAIFDLGESVDRQTPKIRKMLRYVRWFVSIWLLLDFFFVLALAEAKALALLEFVPIIGFLLAMGHVREASTRFAFFVAAAIFGSFQVLTFGAGLLVGVVLVTLFFLGFLILELMRDLRSFFDYFALRHRVIQRVRRADPTTVVPQGKDPAERILAHLASTSPDVRAVLSHPGALAVRGVLTGRTGLTYGFDAYLRSEPSNLARAVGLGPPGFAIFVKAFEAAPSLSDLQLLKRAVEDVSEATRIPPARVLAVWREAGERSVAADAYDFVIREAVRVRIRGSTYACSLELAREGEDGTYDFIPVVVEAAVGTAFR